MLIYLKEKDQEFCYLETTGFQVKGDTVYFESKNTAYEFHKDEIKNFILYNDRGEELCRHDWVWPRPHFFLDD